MKLLAIVFTLIFTINHTIKAQDLSNYQWKNRILLIISEQTEDPSVRKQLKEVQTNSEDMDERKLEVILSTKDNIYIVRNLAEAKIKLPNYGKYKSTALPFEMILIGLDGGIKKRYTEYTPLKDIFSLIDGMPMRKAELKKSGQ